MVQCFYPPKLQIYLYIFLSKIKNGLIQNKFSYKINRWCYIFINTKIIQRFLKLVRLICIFFDDFLKIFLTSDECLLNLHLIDDRQHMEANLVSNKTDCNHDWISILTFVKKRKIYKIVNLAFLKIKLSRWKNIKYFNFICLNKLTKVGRG